MKFFFTIYLLFCYLLINATQSSDMTLISARTIGTDHLHSDPFSARIFTSGHKLLRQQHPATTSHIIARQYCLRPHRKAKICVYKRFRIPRRSIRPQPPALRTTRTLRPRIHPLPHKPPRLNRDHTPIRRRLGDASHTRDRHRHAMAR